MAVTDQTTRLLQAIPHITHDVSMMCQALELSSVRVGWVTWYVMARNVANFLTVQRKGDISALDYLSESEAGAWRRQAAPEIGLVIGSASELATHLSWKRVDEAASVQEPSKAVTDALILLWSDFLARVPEPYRAEFVRSLAGQQK